MKKTIQHIALLTMAVMALSSCSKTQKVSKTYAYASYETTCLGSGHDGSETVRAWGSGNTKAEAIEQARKNAVYGVVFKGIKGKDCTVSTIVHEVNAAERYADYFNPFFSVGGEYTRFCKVEMGAPKPLIESKGTNRVSYGVVVTVDRAALKSQLAKDGILSENYAY